MLVKDMHVPQRSESIDFLRGGAIVGMVLFHALFLARFWFGFTVPFADSILFPLLGRSSALLFFLLSGAVSWLSFHRWRKTGLPASFITARFARRSTRVWLAALSVTLGTSFLVPADTVWFGALHFLAAGNFLLLPLLFLPPKSWPLLAVLSVGAGWGLSSLSSGNWLALPLGITPSGFRTLDYYPLFPWLAALLCGAWLVSQGRTLGLPQSWRVRPLVLLGRHSLLIYLLHVPVLWLGFSLWTAL